jgi:hypothetical protein
VVDVAAEVEGEVLLELVDVAQVAGLAGGGQLLQRVLAPST